MIKIQYCDCSFANENYLAKSFYQLSDSSLISYQKCFFFFIKEDFGRVIMFNVVQSVSPIKQCGLNGETLFHSLMQQEF